jgi:cytosine/adenosine deaminase-related metal-dependent hydrolase
LLDEIRSEVPGSWPEIEQFTRDAVAKFHRPGDGLTIALGPSGPQRCTDEMLAGCARLADELDIPIHIHVLETRMQAVSAQRMYGKTLPEHLRELGLLSPRVSFEHGIWLTPNDVELVRDAGVTIVHNPVSNLKLGSGICPVPTLLGEGVNVALGTDGMSSNDGNDMLWALKLASILHKVWEIDYEEWLGAQEAWQMATAAGAESAGYADDLGRIAPGFHADVVLLDLESLGFTPLNDPLKQLALGATARDVASVMIGGRWVMRERALIGIDEEAVLDEARERGRDVVSRYDAGFEVGRKLLDALRAGWWEAFSTDVGVLRKL